MASGVTVQPDCVTTFNEIKLGHKYRYIIYSLTDNLREIKVLQTANPEETYDDFVSVLLAAEQAKECRYGVYDADYMLPDGQKRSKLVFFMWSPDGATIKQKMVYTSSKEAIKRKLVGLGKEVQACDEGELAWSNVYEILCRTDACK